MNCNVIQGRVLDLADGHLTPGNRLWVEEHLRECPACREKRADLEGFLEECREALACPGPRYSFAALKARMDAIQPLDEVVLFLPRLRTENRFARYAVAMVMAIMILGAPTALRHARTIHAAIQRPVNGFQQVANVYETYIDDPSLLQDSKAPPWKDHWRV